jgi:hypothetical protein
MNPELTRPLGYVERRTPGPDRWTQEPILRHTVAWTAANRCFDTLAEAWRYCEANDFDPELNVQPVIVAESAHGYRVIVEE